LIILRNYCGPRFREAQYKIKEKEKGLISKAEATLLDISGGDKEY
jgi:hypothetical protein